MKPVTLLFWVLGYTSTSPNNNTCDIIPYKKDISHNIQPLITKWIDSLHLELSLLSKKSVNEKFYSPIIKQLNDTITNDRIISLLINDLIIQSNLSYIKSKNDLLIVLQYLINNGPSFNQSNFYSSVPITVFFTKFLDVKSFQMLCLNEKWNELMFKLLKHWKNYLDSYESTNVINDGINGWLNNRSSEFVSINDYIKEINYPPFWLSWNKFFSRDIKRHLRPISGLNNGSIITSPTDGVFIGLYYNISLTSIYWLKEASYSLIDIFSRKLSNYSLLFENGIIFKTLLHINNFHRFWSPVNGKIVLIEHISGLYLYPYSSNQINYTPYIHLNTRVVIILKTDNIGHVTCIPVGIADISSIKITAKAGNIISKGDELGYFLYGGSIFVTILEDLSKYNKEITFNQSFYTIKNHKVNIGNQIATIKNL